VPVTLAAAFLCGTIALLVGAVRAIAAARRLAADLERPELGPAEPPVRRWLPSLAWSAIAVYGLVLASAGIILAR
jgi:hypothetical protein